MVKKIFLILLAIIISSSNISYANEINSRKYIVYDRNSGIKVMGKNEDKETPMASTTKIMTATVVLENCSNLNKEVEVGQRAAGIGGSKLELKKGDKITIRDLLFGLLLRSGNDCAIQLAEEISGSVEDFIKLMNDKAKELNLKDTHFVTPHGLDDPKHYTTAYELAKITDYSLKNNVFASIVQTKYATIRINNQAREIKNTNELLMSNIEGIYGVKTGFTNLAGRCLVTAIKKDNMDLIIVTIGADTKKDRGKDTIELIKAITEKYRKVNIEEIAQNAFLEWKNINMNRIIVERGNSKINLKLGKCEPKEIITNSEITTEINSISYKKAPILKNEKVGELIVKNGSDTLETIEIFNTKDVKRRNVMDYIRIFAKEYTC